MKYCNQCGGTVQSMIPNGDIKLRLVCTVCEFIHYENKQLFINMMDEHIDYNNIHISNAYHFFWWLIFCFGFQKMSCNLIKYKNIINLNYSAFYTHELMQKWSMYVHHKDLLSMESILDHKLPFKNYIYKFTNDKNYRNNKNKESSWSRGFIVDATWDKKLKL